MHGIRHASAHPAPLAVPRLLKRLSRLFAHVLARLAEWQERAEQRSHLARMDDTMLKDIGVSASEAWREANKPFWRP